MFHITSKMKFDVREDVPSFDVWVVVKYTMQLSVKEGDFCIAILFDVWLLSEDFRYFQSSVVQRICFRGFLWLLFINYLDCFFLNTKFLLYELLFRFVSGASASFHLIYFWKVFFLPRKVAVSEPLLISSLMYMSYSNFLLVLCHRLGVPSLRSQTVLLRCNVIPPFAALFWTELVLTILVTGRYMEQLLMKKVSIYTASLLLIIRSLRHHLGNEFCSLPSANASRKRVLPMTLRGHVSEWVLLIELRQNRLGDEPYSRSAETCTTYSEDCSSWISSRNKSQIVVRGHVRVLHCPLRKNNRTIGLHISCHHLPWHDELFC